MRISARCKECNESNAEGTQSRAHIIALHHELAHILHGESSCNKLPFDHVKCDGDVTAFRIVNETIQTQVRMGEQQLNHTIA